MQAEPRGDDGGPPGHPGAGRQAQGLKEMLLRYSTQFYWNGTVRKLLAEEPEVLQ